jgi:hypothetical protein
LLQELSIDQIKDASYEQLASEKTKDNTKQRPPQLSSWEKKRLEEKQVMTYHGGNSAQLPRSLYRAN